MKVLQDALEAVSARTDVPLTLVRGAPSAVCRFSPGSGAGKDETASFLHYDIFSSPEGPAFIGIFLPPEPGGLVLAGPTEAVSSEEAERLCALLEKALAAPEEDGPEDFSVRREQLVREFRAGQPEKAREVLDSLMDEILLSDSDFSSVRLRFFEIFMLLCGELPERDIPLQKAFGTDFDPLQRLSDLRGAEELRVWLTDCLDRLSVRVYSPAQSPYSETIARALAVIEERYAQKLTLRELAQQQGINESYLSKLFKKEMGVNFTDYLNELRIGKSIGLMDNSAMSLSKIAVQVGFEDQSYFTKIFKKVTGQTPKHYKKLRHGSHLRDKVLSAANSEYLHSFYRVR